MITGVKEGTEEVSGGKVPEARSDGKTNNDKKATKSTKKETLSDRGRIHRRSRAHSKPSRNLQRKQRETSGWRCCRGTDKGDIKPAAEGREKGKRLLMCPVRRGGNNDKKSR